VTAEPAHGLIGDVGGTNVRFAVLDRAGRISGEATLSCADHPDIEAAITRYLVDITGGDRAPASAALAVAGPVDADGTTLTNLAWTISVDRLRETFGFSEIRVINDFMAIALALPRLEEKDRRPVGGGMAVRGAPIAVLGPGTGLGVSAMIPGPGGFVPLATEGGHVTLAGFDSEEDAVIVALRERFGHASAERALSGPGLTNIHAALAGRQGRPAEALTPQEVTERAIAGDDPLCAAALAMFFSFLGTVAANLTLSIGARGGVYIAGGIVPPLADALEGSGFRDRFESKGRFSKYLAAIPTYVITHPQPAFLGLARLIADSD